MRPGEPVRFDSRCLSPSADALTGSSSTKFRERETGFDPATSLLGKHWKLCAVILTSGASPKASSHTAAFACPVQAARSRDALETIPCLTVHLGHFLSHPARMPLAHP